MKYILSSNYILQTVGEDSVLLPCGTDREVDLSKMIVLNDTGAMLISCMEDSFVTFDQLAIFMKENFEIESEEYKKDLTEFLNELISKGIIDIKQEE